MRKLEKKKKKEKKGKKYKQLLVIRDIFLKLVKCLDLMEKLQAVVHVNYCLVFAEFLWLKKFTYLATDFKNTNFAS